MYKLKISYVVFFVLVSFQNVVAQDTQLKIPITKRHLYAKYIPFDSVQILDNRINDTIIIYQSGTYPHRIYSFTYPTMQDYWQKSTAKMQKGKEKLLINITQMRVPNNSEILRKYCINRTRGMFSTGYRIVFSANVYYENKDGFYRKLFSINKNYEYSLINVYICTSVIMNELISISGYIYNNNILNEPSKKYDKKIRKIIQKKNYFSGNIMVINSSKDTNEYTLSQINVNTVTHWKNYLIVNKKPFHTGLYITFDDFRGNRILSYPIQINFNDTDSTYTINWTKQIRDSLYLKYQQPSLKTKWLLKYTSPYAISDGENLYINISGNKYLKLYQQDNTFYFYVPQTLPNMYTQLSLKNSDNYTSADVLSTGNILGDLIGTLVMSVANSISNNEVRKEIINNGNNNKYRTCYIDMDNGDFMYK